jgi:hypothetical protein
MSFSVFFVECVIWRSLKLNIFMQLEVFHVELFKDIKLYS